MGAGILETYREFLPVTDATPLISMGEGNTPLVKSNRLGKELGCEELYFKLEGCNPTGSFKDRGMVVAMAKALEDGSRAVMCASTGNTSASAAAYGAYCDLPVLVLIPKGEVAMGKLAQAMAYGARILMINGNFDSALALARAFTCKHSVTLVNSVNPHRLEGQKTGAFEIIESLGEAPDYLFIPVGNAGNITAYWRGFREYQGAGRSLRLPKMMGFQAEGAAPIVRGAPVANPQTIASAIRIGNPASWQGAVDARDSSGGTIDMVSDDEILDAYRMIASKEGIFCEPASAAAFAGLVKMCRQGLNLEGQRVVCIFTGNGLKDPDLAVRSVVSQTTEIEPTLEAVEAASLVTAS
ncbi:MAG: threonine synthase [Dehalococcoidia bacterium]|jgi:threonine synthase|nr:threonine synthase [Dehalococcoidia bacterium]MEE2928940.1 threonine synthase [Chloroflexota bacterium]HIB10934.1 threonine synthase [Dehalococcoidia bacterium]|tara:strand:+ start:1519 stop:2580 length:1062 start_codon:yes stop_codon:yes gene_type:complete